MATKYRDSPEIRKFMLRCMHEGITKPSDLMRFIVYLTGEVVPTQPVCHDHQTPWDMIRDIYFDRVTVGFGLGARSGYKTTAVAKLNAAELLCKPGIEIVSMAAIDKQSKRCYKLTVKYLDGHPLLQKLGILEGSIMEETLLSNGSRYAQATGTLNSISGQHPNRLRIDEVELMKPEVLEESPFVPASYDGQKKSLLYTSIRKKATGNVQKLIDDNPYMKVWTFCWKDIVEPCPDKRSGVIPTVFEVDDIYSPGDRLPVEGFDGCRRCPLVPACRAEAKRAKGIYPIPDLIDEFRTTAPSQWIAQKECRLSQSIGARFAEFNTDLQVGDYPYDPNLSCDVSIDFGASHKTAVLFIQDIGVDSYVVHEHAARNKPSDYHSYESYIYAKEHDIRTRGQIGDQAAKQNIIDFNSNPDCEGYWKIRGGPKPPTKDLWEAEIERMIRDTAGDRHLFIDRSCVNLIKELRSWDGKKDEGNDSIAALGYWRWWRLKNGAPRIESRVMNMARSGKSRSGREEPRRERKPITPIWQIIHEELLAED